MNSLNQNAQLPAGETPPANPKKWPPKISAKKALKIGGAIFAVYVVGLIGFLLWSEYDTRKYLADFYKRSAATMEEVSEYDKADVIAAVENLAARRRNATIIRRPANPFDLAPVQIGGGRQASTNMLEQAVRGELGPRQQQAQERLDYSAQVAVYEAQLKEQEDRRLAEEARKREQQEAIDRHRQETEKLQQERLAQQQAIMQKTQQQTQAPAPTPAPVKVQQPSVPTPKPTLATSPKVTSGGSSGGGFGTGSKSASFQPKPVQPTQTQQKQSTQAAQTTQLNKLETNRIYNK